jgi:hypothetical protein
MKAFAPLSVAAELAGCEVVRTQRMDIHEDTSGVAIGVIGRRG